MAVVCAVARAGAQARQLPSETFCSRVGRLRWLGSRFAFVCEAKSSLRLPWHCYSTNAFAMRCVAASMVFLAIVAGAAEPHEDLKPLGAIVCTRFFRVVVRSCACRLFPCPISAQRRQQHRRTLDGRLCAAAFVFDRQTHTGCSDGSNPDGEHGREWCYVDAQVARRHRQDFARVV